jgi:hypothetical protein
MAAPVLTPAAIHRQHAERDVLGDESVQLESIYEIIFQDLGPADDVSALAARLVDLVGSSRDVFIEMVNMIAAAAAIARSEREYNNLVALVVALAPEREPEPAAARRPGRADPARPGRAEPWGDLGFRLAEACLQRHLGQTNYFLLRLLNDGVFRPYVLYKYVRNQGALRPLNTALLLYFARELKAFRESWFEGEWRRAIADMRESPRGFLSILKEYHATRADDWAGTLAARRTGLDSDALRSIAEDDVAAFQRADLRPDAPVPYSPFNDFFHFQYEFKVTDGRLDVVCPTLMDAVGLFGAQNIFEYIMTRHKTTADVLVSSTIHSLVAGTTAGNQFAQIAVEQNGAQPDDTLRDAIRWHNHEVFAYLIDAGAPFDQPAVDAVFRHSNLRVFLSHRDRLTTQEQNVDGAPPAPTLFHFMARGNSVHAFKTALLADPNGVNPFAVANDAEKRTFLHWAANYGAREVTRQWARLWGNRGFDALDAHNWNPSHYAFMTGLSDEPPPGGKGYGKYACSKPFYHYIVKRSELEYDPDTDPDVEEWPDAAVPGLAPAPPPRPPPVPPLPPDAAPDDAPGPQ